MKVSKTILWVVIFALAAFIGIASAEVYTVESEQDTVLEEKSEDWDEDTDIDDEDWINRHDEAYERWLKRRKMLKSFDRKRGKKGVFVAGAGGWELCVLPLELDELNSQLSQIGLPDFKSELLMSGFGGWGFVGKGVRIGGFGATGTLISSGKPVDIAKEAEFSLHIGGFTIDKVFRPFYKTEISIGSMIGGGTASLKLSQASGPLTWGEMWGAYTPDSDETTLAYHDYRNKASTSLFTLLPNIGLRYNILRWCAIGLNAGYLYTHLTGSGWEMDEKTVHNVPAMDFSNVIYRVNIYFGG